MADNAAELIETAKHDTEDAELGYMHPVYYCLQTRSKAGWGQQELLLNSLAKVGCKIIDFRTFHPHDHVGLAHVVNELYIKDLRLSLVLHEELDADDVEKLKGRITEIIGPVKEALGNDEKTEVKMSRWLPGRGHEGGNKAQDADGGRKRQGSAFDRQAEKSVHENLKQFMKKWHSKHDKRHCESFVVVKFGNASKTVTCPTLLQTRPSALCRNLSKLAHITSSMVSFTTTLMMHLIPRWREKKNREGREPSARPLACQAMVMLKWGQMKLYVRATNTTTKTRTMDTIMNTTTKLRAGSLSASEMNTC